MNMVLEKPKTDSDTTSDKYSIGWFSTGRDPAARNLLEAVYEKRHELGPSGIELPFVFCNYEPGENPAHKDYNERQEFFSLVNSYGIELISLSWMPYKEKYTEEWRGYYGEDMQKALQNYSTDLDVAAGFMLWVPENVCSSRKMINLHPALPGGPEGTWQEVIWKLIAMGAEETGAQMHRLTPNWDEGPPVTYFRFSIGNGFEKYWTDEERSLKGEDWRLVRDTLGEDNLLFQKIREYGEAREIPLVEATINAFASRRIRIADDGKIYDQNVPLGNGYDLTKLVESRIG